MRINHEATTRKTAGRIPAGTDVSAIWTLTGVALLAACAHDGTSYFDAESGGGDEGPNNQQHVHLSIASGIIAIMFGSGGSGGGGGGGGSGVRTTDSSPSANRAPSGQELPVFAVTGTNEHDSSSDLNARAAVLPDSGYGNGQVGQDPSHFPFQGSDPDNDQLLFSSASVNMNGRSSERTPEERYDETSFNYGSMVRGQYGSLYYNDVTGAWTFEADARKINAVSSTSPASEVFEMVTRSIAQARRPGPARAMWTPFWLGTD